jgi:glycosyltransferase involved in cell wall biosynthesis
VSATGRRVARDRSKFASGGAPGRVLIVSENAPVPSDRRVWNIARSLETAGWEVTIICAAGSDRDQLPKQILEGIEIHRFALRSARNPLDYGREYLQAMVRIRALARQLAQDRPFDLVHACNPPDTLLLAVRFLRRRGTRFIFDHHDLAPELYVSKFDREGDPGHRLMLAGERLAYRLADVSLATNGSYARIAIERGRMAPEDVFVVRNGPDLTRFKPAAADPTLRRGKEHLISYLGIMSPQDGVDHAIRALAWLARQRDDWHAIFIGDGSSIPSLRDLAAGLGIADSVEFAGWRGDADICQILSSSDVCLAPDPPSPLNDASTMIKIPEYMAMGRAVASYDLRESRVSAAGAALYAEPGNHEALGHIVKHLLDDPEQRRAMGQLGIRRVHDELAWRHSEAVLLDAYTHALVKVRA